MTDNEERMLEELDTLQEEFKKIENPDINDMNRILDKIGQIDAEIAKAPGVLQTNTLNEGTIATTTKPLNLIEAGLIEQTPDGKDLAKLMRNLDRIEQKSNCTIVKLLDKTANYIEKTSEKIVNYIRNLAIRISTPCSIVKPTSWLDALLD